MQAITIRIPRLRTYIAGDRYSIYGNDGLGEVDYEAVPLVSDAPFWPGTLRHAGHLNGGHLCWGHLDHVTQDGHLVGRHLEHGHLEPEALLRFVTPLYCLGHYAMAVCVDDAGGNRSASAPAMVSCTINSSPRAASDFAKAGYDEQTDQIRFTFSPSLDFVS